MESLFHSLLDNFFYIYIFFFIKRAKVGCCNKLFFFKVLFFSFVFIMLFMFVLFSYFFLAVIVDMLFIFKAYVLNISFMLLLSIFPKYSIFWFRTRFFAFWEICLSYQEFFVFGKFNMVY